MKDHLTTLDVCIAAAGTLATVGIIVVSALGREVPSVLEVLAVASLTTLAGRIAAYPTRPPS